MLHGWTTWNAAVGFFVGINNIIFVIDQTIGASICLKAKDKLAQLVKVLF